MFQEPISIEERNEGRRRQIHEFCRNNAARARSNLDLTSIIVNQQHKVLYCYIPKVACTQWKSVFAGLKGYFPPPHVSVHYAPKGTYTYLEAFSAEERKHILRNYYKFVFVREPMERLLSAYKDKFSDSCKDLTFKNAWGKFVLGRKADSMPKNNLRISFEDFLRFVGSESRWQEHWERFYKLCHPCVIDYDFIGHFENIEHEAPFVMEASGLSRNTTISFPAYRPSNTTSKVLHSFSKIPPNLIAKVAELYKTDFELFGYPFPGRLWSILKGNYSNHI